MVRFGRNGETGRRKASKEEVKAALGGEGTEQVGKATPRQIYDQIHGNNVGVPAPGDVAVKENGHRANLETQKRRERDNNAHEVPKRLNP